MPNELAMTFSGVLVGAMGGILTVLVCLIGKLAIELVDEYLWLVADRYLLPASQW